MGQFLVKSRMQSPIAGKYGDAPGIDSSHVFQRRRTEDSRRSNAGFDASKLLR
jgi:hypothetical protein